MSLDPRKITLPWLVDLLTIAGVVFAAAGFYYQTRDLPSELKALKAAQAESERERARLEQLAADKIPQVTSELNALKARMDAFEERERRRLEHRNR